MPGTLSSGGNIIYAYLITPTFTPVSVGANTTAEQSFTVPGLQLNDNVSCYSLGAQTAGVGVANCRVSANNTLQLGFSNSTAGVLTPVAGLYYMCICRPLDWPLPSNAA